VMREGFETKVYIWQAWVRREWEYLPDVSMYLWFNVDQAPMKINRIKACMDHVKELQS